MIQLTGDGQLSRAAARLQKERHGVRRHEAGRYDVTNKAKGHNYMVSFLKLDGRTFATCTCPAGLPLDGNRIPKLCKHVAAAAICHNGINAARRAAKAAPVTVPAFCDDDDPDAMEANW